MTEKHPNTQPIENLNPQVMTPLIAEQSDMQVVPQAAIESEIERSVAPLRDYQERGGIGGENRRLVGERILQVAGIVRDNPERVAADIKKSPLYRTEHDPARAHLIALTVDKNMTRLVADKRRIDAGKRIWRRARHEQALLGSKMGENMATKVYDNDPLEAGPNLVESRRQLSISAGNRVYKYIGKVKGSL